MAEPDWLVHLRAHARSSRMAAVRLFCIECMGGSRSDAIRCESRSCALWLHAFKRGERARTVHGDLCRSREGKGTCDCGAGE